MAADQGSAEGQYRLGVMYLGTQKIKKDFKEVAKWVRMAAEQDHARAQRLLGSFYEEGWGGLPENPEEAARLYRKASEQGYAQAQWDLGKLYRDGKGLPEDYIQAYAYFMAAEINGRSYAQLDKKKIAKRMTVDDINRAKQLGQELIDKYPAK